ncbi:MAG: 4-hydroxy-tetrahydrodipicolinate reductase [Phycisphaeraceae bacterium]|nr:4-hydroxy-tetrahydrodipicolinate reductase [Phycisphaeraceae bacterium]
MIGIVINGAAGRMGRRLIALAAASAELKLAAALERPDCPQMGQDAGILAGIAANGVAISSQIPPNAGARVLIDFSAAAALPATIALCRQHKLALVCGITGLTAADQKRLDDAARDVPVIWESNFSLVVNVLHSLLRQAAPLLGEDYDIEILEAHHRGKHDAPSGTALSLARTLCSATGRDFDKDVVLQRHGPQCPRKKSEITIQALRLGDLAGQHTIYFAAEGERLELTHVSTSRDSYVKGALQAARWIADKGPGRYSMRQVLGL